jgi:hypothetical protein
MLAFGARWPLASLGLLFLFACRAPVRGSAGPSPAGVDVVMPPDASAPSSSAEKKGEGVVTGPHAASRPSRLGVGGLAMCLAKQNGSVSCIGSLGYRDPRSTRTKKKSDPWTLEGIPAAADVALGNVHGCIRTRGGEVWCWGQNVKGELGRGRASAGFETPAVVPALSNVAQLASGADYTCARTGEGRVWCWGTPFGEADKLDDLAAKPLLIPDVEDAVDISVTSMGACATIANGTARCWHAGPRPNGVNPLEEADATKLSDVAEISIGVSSSCARTRAGKVVTSPLRCEVSLGMQGGMPTVGRGSPGWTAKGNGTWANVAGITSAKHVAAGGVAGCGVVDGGSVLCWGCPSWSFMKYSGPTPAQATKVPELTDVEELAMSLVSACVRKRDDTVMCWGTHLSGIISDVPVPVAF